MDKLKKRIVRLMREAKNKLSQRDLIKLVCKETKTPEADAKAAVKTLVGENKLMYTNHYGRSYIEISSHRPNRVSKHILLCPPYSCVKNNEKDIVIKLTSGVSFGNGDHPTTRLCLRAVDYLLSDGGPIDDPVCKSALDIGTGSGILVIASVLLGIGRAVGTDIDPMSIYEAGANILVNGLSDRIRVMNGTLSEDKFDLVIANLRTPTLMGLCPNLLNMLTFGGFLVISGVRNEEHKQILNMLESTGYLILRCYKEKDWRSYTTKWLG